MNYVALIEGIAIAVLWGAWRAKKSALATEAQRTDAWRTAYTAAVNSLQRIIKELEVVSEERDAARKELDAHATPESTRNDLNRLLAR